MKTGLMGNGLITQDERESEVYKKWLKESRKKAVAKKMGKKEKWGLEIRRIS